ncbi:hypothetical protein QTO34_017367 [Cnephaeus nilssonii]|uniref:Mitochondrial inner membrane protease ATP23 n=1 Tax=Cnephaeus nilssonii TaxID=3371016 RepID=A0AA40LR66_CNENI|nr:hypothetical protein QTO34_017367 [Eptesicus nilssonii]
MAGAPGAAGQASAEQLAPEQPQPGVLASFLTSDQKCQLMLLRTLQTRKGRAPWFRGSGSAPGAAGRALGSSAEGPGWVGIMGAAVGGLGLFPFPSIHNRINIFLDPYVKLLLDAMKHSGCAVNRERHFSCEDCNGNVSGGFDASVSQIVLCQNNIRNQAHMNRVVTHELIHTFDHCRAHVDWFTNVRHLACSETCVRDRAILSILAVRNVSKEVAEKAVDEVFESCFNDHEPFGRIPHNKTYAKYAHRDFQNRHRYYSNI